MRRYAVRGLCRDCGAPVLVGLDADVAALDVTVDPRPLSTQGEALALLGGRLTYALRRRGRHHELARRDHWQIAGRGVLDRRGSLDVLADHRCGADVLPGAPSQLDAHRPSTPRKGPRDRPPF